MCSVRVWARISPYFAIFSIAHFPRGVKGNNAETLRRLRRAERLAAPAVRLAESVGHTQRKSGISYRKAFRGFKGGTCGHRLRRGLNGWRHLRCGLQSQLGTHNESLASATEKLLGDLKGGTCGHRLRRGAERLARRFGCTACGGAFRVSWAHTAKVWHQLLKSFWGI